MLCHDRTLPVLDQHTLFELGTAGWVHYRQKAVVRLQPQNSFEKSERLRNSHSGVCSSGSTMASNHTERRTSRCGAGSSRTSIDETGSTRMS